VSASLCTRLALPDDPDIDTLDSGVAEVDLYFQGRTWFNASKQKAAPPTYQFLTEDAGKVIGYAAAAFRNSDHPHDGSSVRARYLVVYALGVHRPFQGVENPRAPGESFAASIVGVLVAFARERVGCVGLSLWVRVNNARAIAFYRRCGFQPDPGGPVQRNGGAAHLTMRLLL